MKRQILRRFFATRTRTRTCTRTRTRPKSETVEGVWIFHRHGDRTPNTPLVSEPFMDDEANFWRSKIPPIDGRYYNILSNKFPVDIHESYENKFLDADRGSGEPYGFLSWKGMEQMYLRGREISKRYSTCIDGDGDGYGRGKEQLTSMTDQFDIKAFSTNYLRTVKSCQCFLDGLLSDSSSSLDQDTILDIGDENENENDDGYDAKCESSHYKRIDPSDYQTYSGVTIQVRDREKDTLNAFDTSPELMKRLVREVATQKEFIDRDTKTGATLGARLCHFLPGLMKYKSPGSGMPSGMFWFHASDHFICRSSHSLPFSRYSHVESSSDFTSAEQTLQAMSHSVHSHLAWRFGAWYQNPALLAASSGPTLAGIKNQIHDIISNGGIGDHDQKNNKKPFVIYSCHDVTLLSLLYGLGADIDGDNEGDGNLNDDDRRRFWPEYASTLVIELSRIESSVDRELDEGYVIKIFLNGEPVRAMTTIRGNKECMNPSDFATLVKNLNDSVPSELKK